MPGYVSPWSQIENGYFVHYFAPEGLSAIPKNVVFVIDTSGSMRGRKIQQVGSVGQGRVLKAGRLWSSRQTCSPPIFLGRGLPGIKVGQSMGQVLPLEHSQCPHSRCESRGAAQGHMSPQGVPTETPTFCPLPLTRPGKP